ncbi:hypothetical protein L195_g015945 [Trifolium pratense]|uniref:DUF7870 domain-containing protein n=1 Tax=Trifolium pratense TaxID=57577 RepID=A0A2K3LI51_TRIPR|nr:hypothetical protein L195_g034189 [Trifolium pratense]PNX92803.1 hypothetical protein L195_g015945 [Trifolium pratense]
MDTKILNFQILNGSIKRRVFFRSILLAATISMVALLRLRALSDFNFGNLVPIATNFNCFADSDNNVTLNQPSSNFFQNRFWGVMNCEKDVNLTVNVVTELMGMQFLNCEANTLCVGEGSSMAVKAMKQLGFSTVSGVYTNRFFSLKMKRFIYELDYQDCSFDFVLSRDLDKVSVPALLVLEVERVLKPNGIGALLVGAKSSHHNDLIRSATPVSSLLRSSSVVHVDSIDDELNLVVFKKRSQNATTFFNHNQISLPADCPSLTLTKPLIDLMEPLVSEKPMLVSPVSYLPKFVDVSARKRLVYIDIGVGELLNANVSDWFLPSYPIDQKDFNVYFVHYNTSIMLSYVKRPGITFVYHPGLAGKVTAEVDDIGDKDEDLDHYGGEEEFDFLAWFKETVQYADFVVLKMNAGEVELKFLSDVFDSGAICFVDELFLRCPEKSDDDKTNALTSKENCMDVYKSLRSNGVYVHQLWGDEIAYKTKP